MSVNWHDLLLAWLREPPDQVLEPQGSLTRAARYASAVFGYQYPLDKLLEILPEAIPLPLESGLPVLPAPANGLTDTGQTITLGEMDSLTTPDEQGRRIIHHPLSGTPLQLTLALETGQYTQQCEETIADLTRSCPDDHSRLLSLWRFLPTRMATLVPALALLPANAQVPDHTVWNTLDMRVALTAACSDGQGGALLSFTLGPVQSFIMQARSLRDLWAGSYLLSWLTFAAMQPVLDAYGPTALIFPSLRGNPLYDLTLWERYNFAPFDSLNRRLKSQQPDVLLTGSLPNTFLALVPVSAADDLARHVEQCVSSGHGRRLDRRSYMPWSQRWGDRTQWAMGWEDQVGHFWDIHSVVLPLQPASGTSLADHFTTLLWPHMLATRRRQWTR